MKTIKPGKLGLLTRPFEHDRKYYLAAAIMAFFPLNQPERLLSEQKLWRFLPGEIGAGAVFDEGLPKQNGEVLVKGACHCPKQRARLACPVTVKIGGVQKTLNVFGDRFWENKGRLTVATEPKPFLSLALGYENAFGGRDYPLNPLGKGFSRILDRAGRLIHPLPNVELPDHLITAPNDRPQPAGFGPLDLSWPQRSKKAGYYDQKWLKERFPGFPADMDWTIFNQAPSDQQISGFFRGDEPITLENMHPQKHLLKSRLPGLAVRLFINQQTRGEEIFKEIPTRLDTVWLFPGAERGVAIFRGVFETADGDAEDVRQMLVGGEPLGDPRPADYYRQVFQTRIDPEKGYLFALRDQDLLPPEKEAAAPAGEESDEFADWLASEDLLRQNVARGAERELENARRMLAAQGLDPNLYLPEKLPEDEPLDLERPDLLMEESEKLIARGQKEAEEKLALAEKQFRAVMASHNLDPDQYLAEAKRQAAGRPKFKAAELRDQLKAYQEQMLALGRRDPEFDRLIEDPHLDRKLAEMEEMLEESYRKYAHHFPAAILPPAEQARRLGLAAIADYKAGQSLEGRDLSGADLSDGLLARASLKNAILEGANLRGTDLSRADLSGAVLARADLTGADLSQANLQGANLALANLSGARLNQTANLSSATLNQADLSGADLTGANLSGADLTEAVFRNTNLTRVTAPAMVFKESDLRTVVFRGADLTKVNFIKVDLTGVDFQEARLDSVTFMQVKAGGSGFQQASLQKFRAIMESDLAGANFSRADLTMANLRGVNLEKGQFVQTVLEEADLSSANLRGADFYRARARGARFIKADLELASLMSANLWGANFQNAQLHRTIFKGANLFGANFLKARADRETDFTDAFLRRAFFKA